MATSRTRSRIETELPAELRREMNRLLLQGATYEEASAWCSEQGVDISKSAIGRYGKKFFEAYQAITQFEDQSRAIVSATEEGLPMEEALGKLLMQKAMAAVVEEDFDIIANAKLIGQIARLQSSHINLAKHKMDLEAKAAHVAEECNEIAKKGGLSDEVADQIRRKILGISK